MPLATYHSENLATLSTFNSTNPVPKASPNGATDAIWLQMGVPQIRMLFPEVSFTKIPSYPTSVMAEWTKEYLTGTNQHASASYGVLLPLTLSPLGIHQDLTTPLTTSQQEQGTCFPRVSLSSPLPSVPIHAASGQPNLVIHIHPPPDLAHLPLPHPLCLGPNKRLRHNGRAIPTARVAPAERALEKFDILAPVPEELCGRYDVATIQFFSLMVTDNDVGTLLGNLLSLVKPGGYLQWIEPDISASRAVSPRPDICREAYEALMRDATRFLKDFQISYEYLAPRPPNNMQKHGMTKIMQCTPSTIQAIRPIFGYGTIGAYEEFSYLILDKYGPTPSLGSGDDLWNRLGVVRKELERKVAFEQPIYVLVARKAMLEG
ncbi:hypothetical protein BDV10DRAFT_189245 [Aspergillus recurvatus]